MNLSPAVTEAGTFTLTSSSTEQQLSLFVDVPKKSATNARGKCDGSTMQSVLLRDLRGALSLIGYALPKEINPVIGGVLQISITGLVEPSQQTGEIQLRVTSGIARTDALSISGASATEKARPLKFSNTRRKLRISSMYRKR